MASDYKNFVPFMLRWEGGKSRDTADSASQHGSSSGGIHTNKGIIYATYVKLAEKVLMSPPTEQQFLNLTDEEAGLFIKYFWDKATYGGTINDQSVSEAMTSWLWGSGLDGGSRLLQKFYNNHFDNILVVDGKIGLKTAEAFNKINHKVMFSELCSARERFFKNLADKKPENKKFLKGWINRLNDLRARWN